MGIAGPQPPASQLSGHRWTSTASVPAQWAPLDLNRQRSSSVGTAGPQRPNNMRKRAPEDMAERS